MGSDFIDLVLRGLKKLRVKGRISGFGPWSIMYIVILISEFDIVFSNCYNMHRRIRSPVGPGQGNSKGNAPRQATQFCVWVLAMLNESSAQT